jgi:hypothetical protein
MEVTESGGASWGDLIDSQAQALLMEAPPPLRETDAERAGRVSLMHSSHSLHSGTGRMGSSHGHHDDALRGTLLPPTRGSTRAPPSSAPGRSSARPLDSRQVRSSLHWGTGLVGSPSSLHWGTGLVGSPSSLHWGTGLVGSPSSLHWGTGLVGSSCDAGFDRYWRSLGRHY